MLRKTLDILSPAERRRGSALLALMVFTAALEVAGVGSLYPFLALIADGASQTSSPFLAWLSAATGVTDPVHFMVLVGALVLAVIVLTNVATAATMWFQVRYVWGVNHGLSVRLLQRYLNQPYVWFLNQNTSRLSKNVLDDAHKVTSGTLDPALTIFSRTVAASAIVGLLILVEPLITLTTLLVLGGAYMAIYLGLRKTANVRGRKWANANTKRYHVAAETFGGAKEVKVQGLEPIMVERFASPSLKYANHYAAATIIKRLPTYAIQTLAFGGITAILIVMILLGRDLGSIVPVVGMFAFAGYRLIPMFQQVLASVVTFRFSNHLVTLIHDDLALLSEPKATARAGRALAPLAVKKGIELREARFAYPNTDRPTLDGIDMQVPARTSVALVGHTGAGKTTLADVLLGLLPLDDGALLVDDEPLDGERVDRWRRSIGYVPQTIYLTDDTIAQNIAFGVPRSKIDMASVRRAASIAQIDDFVSRDLPAGYDTVVGERGVRLSGGQRQRIGIARALYHDPQVLVLDEATSDIDTMTEASITEAIEALAGAKTLIVIAHRLSTIRRCDRIHLMDQGRIVAQGTYDDLVRTSEAFRRLAQTPEPTTPTTKELTP